MALELNEVSLQMLELQQRNAEYASTLESERMEKNKKNQLEIAEVTQKNLLEAEKLRADNQKEQHARNVKMEAIRIAQQVLTENRKNLPADSRQITSEDIVKFSEDIIKYVNE